MKIILIADEGDTVRSFVRRTFTENLGYRIVVTSSGEETVLKAKEIKPDVVLADVSLSDKNGYEVSREIKDDLLLKNTSVILLADSFAAFDSTKAVEVRADGCVIKPSGIKELRSYVEPVTKQSKEREISFVEATLLVIFIIMIPVIVPILYGSIVNKSVNSDPPEVESKLTHAEEREKKEIISEIIKDGGLNKPELIPEEVIGLQYLDEREILGGGEMKTSEPGGEEFPKAEADEFNEKDKKSTVEINKEEAEEKNTASMPTTYTDGKYAIQIGAFRTAEKARKIADSLAVKGYPAFVKTVETPGEKTWYLITIGAFKTREEVELYGYELKKREPLVEEAIVVSK